MNTLPNPSTQKCDTKPKECPSSLIQASIYISNNQFDKAKEILMKFEPESIISDICKRVMLHPNETTDHLFLEYKFDEQKQINMFDTILRSVPCVTETSKLSMKIMKDFYLQAPHSFTHINIGIGKGHFEKQLLTELAKERSGKPYERIKIIGLDIDQSSLKETEQNIKEVNALFDKNTIIEYISICEFAEKLSCNFWIDITKDKTDLTGVTSAFTFHHLQTIESRKKVLQCLTQSRPQLFTLIEPDSDHFTSYLPYRLINCWNLFGTIFEMADIAKLSKAEEYAIKYIFFGREIENILSTFEEQRFEKHDTSTHWLTQLKESGYTMVDKHKYAHRNSLLNFKNQEKGLLTAEYNNVPLVSVFTATT